MFTLTLEYLEDQWFDKSLLCLKARQCIVWPTNLYIFMPDMAVLFFSLAYILKFHILNKVS